MVDPVSAGVAGKAIVKAAGSEPDLPPEAAKFLDQVSGGARREMGALLGDRIRVRRLKAQIRLLDKTQEYLRQAGHEPREVKWNVLLPLIESASLEDDEAMANRWAALLATAADPAADAVPPSFPEILKQLSSTEARILDYYERVPKERFPVAPVNAALPAAAVAHALDLEENDFTLSMDNLYRHRLLEPYLEPDSIRGAGVRIRWSHSRLTVLGRAFVLACRPPESSSS